jgi:hypothetical protein
LQISQQFIVNFIFLQMYFWGMIKLHLANSWVVIENPLAGKNSWKNDNVII